MTVERGVIPAAGRGARLAPLSAVFPKELFPLAGRPVLEWILAEACAAGLRKIAIVIHPDKDVIRSYFRQKTFPGLELDFLYQDPVLGLGDAIDQAREWTKGEPFACMLPDNVIVSLHPGIAQVIETFQQYGSTVVSVIRAAAEKRAEHASFGRLITEPGPQPEVFRATGITDKTAGETTGPEILRGIGRYLFLPGIFRYIDQARASMTIGELDDVDVMRQLILSEQLLCRILAGVRYDTGNWIGYGAACATLFDES